MFPTTCPDCHSPVYFFSCSCGSKVYFDTPGEPWTQHWDNCRPNLARQLINDGYSGARLRALVEERAYAEGKVLDDDTLWLLAKLDANGSTPLVVEEVPPKGTAEVIGTIIDLNERVNFYKRFHYERSPMSDALLAELLEEDHARVVIRCEPSLPAMISYQYEFFVPTRLVRDEQLRRDDVLLVTLSAWSLLDESIWQAQHVSKGETE